MKLESRYSKFYGIAQVLEKNEDEWSDKSEIEVTYLKFEDGYIILKEDPSDGYRSHGYLEVSKECPKELVFNLENYPKTVYLDFDTNYLDKESKRWGHNWNGLLLKYNKNGDIFGSFGTDSSDDYYPCYQCNLDIKKMNELYYQGTSLYKAINKE